MNRTTPLCSTCSLARPARAQSQHRRGFTFIELLIVIAILLTIGSLVVVNLLPARDKADVDLTQVQIDQFEAAMKRFNLDLRRWPTEEEGLKALTSASAIEDETDQGKWTGPYLEQPPLKDNWGSDWIYRNPSQIAEGLPYDIVSVGPDKEEDTDDDIHNHLRMMDAEGEIDEAFDDFTPADGGAGE